MKFLVIFIICLHIYMLYTSDTVYEQNDLLDIGKVQQKMGREMAEKLLQNELVYVEEEKKLKEAETQSYDEWQKVLSDQSVAGKKKLNLQKLCQANQKKTQAASTAYYAEYTKLVTRMSNEIIKLSTLPKYKTV